MLRLAIVILAASTSMIQAASADEVHHGSFADAVTGTWAQRPELCGTTDKSNVTIAAKQYTAGDNTCSVETVVERAGKPGPIYSALARCTDAAGKAQAAYLIIRTEADGRFSIGSTLSDLKPYQRCPAK
jgi:hypothetical protein